MDIYQLDYILHEPEESEGWMYLAEVPTLQGCMAWGDNPRRDLEKPFGSRLEHHPAPEGKRGTAAPGDNPPAQPRRQPDRNRMTYRELRRKLEVPGCRFRRQADGFHEMWVNPANGRRAIIPRHGNRDLATGTLHQIRRDLGISRSDFDQASPKPPCSSPPGPTGSQSRA